MSLEMQSLHVNTQLCMRLSRLNVRLELGQNVLRTTIQVLIESENSSSYFFSRMRYWQLSTILQLKLCVRYVMMSFMPRWGNWRTFHQESPRHEPLFGSTSVIVVRVKQRHSSQHHQQARTSDDNTKQPIWPRSRQRAHIRRQFVCGCRTGWLSWW